MSVTVPEFTVVAMVPAGMNHMVPAFSSSDEEFQFERTFVVARFHTKQEAFDYIDEYENEEVCYFIRNS